jgi:hypothetical protein
MISVDDVQRLLDSDRPDATLVIVGGRPAVVSGEQDDDSGDASGITVISRADLLERAGDRLESEQGRQEVAAELDTVVGQLGG